jgi:dihydrofolate reductase
MKKIILEVAVSLDGYIEGPNGEYDWCFVDQDYGFTDLLKRIDTVFYGRKSFELFGNFVPSENSTEMEKQFFEIVEKKKKYVFSRTLNSVEGAILINKNIEEEVKKIKQEPGKDIYLFGGSSLVTSLLNLNLIDEFRLAVHPIVLGAGKPLFIDIKERKKLKLVDSKIYSNGLVKLFYKPFK